MASEEETLAEFRVLSIRAPPNVDYNKDLEWICRSFGFLEPRDSQKTAYGIFKAMVEAAAQDSGLTSDELADGLSLTRGTMVHHLNKMIRSGLVIHQGGKYKLRGRSLRNTVEEIQRDLNRAFEDLNKIAENIDQTLGLSSR